MRRLRFGRPPQFLNARDLQKKQKTAKGSKRRARSAQPPDAAISAKIEAEPRGRLGATIFAAPFFRRCRPAASTLLYRALGGRGAYGRRSFAVCARWASEALSRRANAPRRVFLAAGAFRFRPIRRYGAPR